jgi:hypothetical protein
MAQMFTPVEHDPFADVGAVPKPGQSVAPGLTPQMLSEQVLGASRATVSALRPYWMDLEPTDAQIAERGDAMQRGISQPGKVPPTTGLDPMPAAAVDALGWMPVGGAAKVAAVGAKAAGLGAKMAPLLSIFAGPRAATADHAALDLAQQMAARGMHRDQIWDATGWFTGADGKWRFEIPDDALSVAHGSGRGIIGPGSAIQHPDLAQAYPGFETLRHDISTAAKRNDVGGYTDAIDYLHAAGVGPERAVSVAAHELQHKVGKAENFALGGNPRMMAGAADAAMREHGLPPTLSPGNNEMMQKAAYQAYLRLAGEVESRNVQARLGMTPAQRRATPPWRTEDVPVADQIVRGANGQSYRLIPVDHDPFAQGPVP